MALWRKLKPLLKAGKFAAIQARELWSTEERVHLRPGHFWPCELGDADGKGSPVVHRYTQKNESHEATDGQKYRGDEGDCLLLIRHYYHRTPDDTTGLTFMRWQAQKGEVLLVNSRELRALTGHQANDFMLTPSDPPPPRLRERHDRSTKAGARMHVVPYPAKQKWRLDQDIDHSTRLECEAM
jgi:hypothetical protein